MSNSTTLLDTISSSQAGKEVTANALFDAGSPATLFGRRASTTGNLTWGYYGGTVMIGGTPTAVANGTIALTGSATNYIEYNQATGALAKNTSGWTGAGYDRVYAVVCGVSTVTSYTDWRYPSIGTAFTGSLSQDFSARNLEAFGIVQSHTPIVAPVRPLQQSSGLLTAMTPATADTGTNPHGIAVDPTGRFVYIVNVGANTVSQYSINQTTGDLVSIGAAIAAGTDPADVAVDPTGRFAYVTNLNANTISQYSINQSNGALTSLGAAIAAGYGPLGLFIEPTGHYLYTTNSAANTVSQYSINQSNGVLTSMGNVSGSVTAYSICGDPTGRFVYTINSANSVSQFSINQANGALTSTGNIAAGNYPLTGFVEPTGRFLYVTNLSANTVSQYSINQANGALTSIGSAVATGLRPHTACGDRLGRYLYITNSNANTVSQYSINQANGALTSLGTTVATGNSPARMVLDPTNRFAYVTNNGTGSNTVSTYVLRDFSVGSGGFARTGSVALLNRKMAEATAILLGATSNITLSLPTGVRLLGVQFRVDTAITGNSSAATWAAAYTGGSSTALVTGQAFTKNTKASAMHVDEITTGTTNITVTPNTGNFTAGVVRALAYYEDFTVMDDAP